MTSTNKHYCSVPQCRTYRSQDITVHMFPKEKNLRKKWAIALRIGKPVSKAMMVCSQHFLPSDFYPLNEYTVRKKLKKGVIPSQKIPIRTHSQNPPKLRQTRNSLKVEVVPDLVQSASTDVETYDVDVQQEREQEREQEPELQVEMITKEFSEIGIQVNTILELKPKCNFHLYLLDSSRNLSVSTGLYLHLFETIEQIVHNTLYSFPNVNKSNMRKKLCLVFTKLKLDLSFRSLAMIFEVSSTTAQNYFHEIIQILYYALKPAIYLPTKEENLQNMPKCFQKYSKVRLIIDATEVSIQKTQCLQCRIRTYSHYKKCHTAKFLVSVCPAGLISHVSSAYGGHTSDKAIFNEEQIISLLDPYHDAIMVDKGVLIEKECLENAIQLIRPPFLRKKKQFSREEALETASIARARVHVERIMQRIKIFKIFTNKLDWALVPYLDEMMVTVCALVNLSKPILKDDKF